jgi:hypothetical protein
VGRVSRQYSGWGRESPSQPDRKKKRNLNIAPGEEPGLSAEDIIANIVQGQTATLLKNPTRLTGISKFDGLRRLSAQSGNVS